MNNFEPSQNRVTCGGTVISAKYSVTAAHCVGGNPEENIVLAGVHDINILTLTNPPQYLIERVNRRRVKNYYTPEGYRPMRSDEHDISVRDTSRILTEKILSNVPRWLGLLTATFMRIFSSIFLIQK